MRIVKFIHDKYHPQFIKLDYCLKENSGYQTNRFIINN